MYIRKAILNNQKELNDTLEFVRTVSPELEDRIVLYEGKQPIFKAYGIEEEIKRLIGNLIKSLGKNHTVILSSHILSEVSQICEKVIIINKGNILAIDTPENLEQKTQEESVIIVTVEDLKGNMKNIKQLLPQIKECDKIKEDEDGTVQYRIESDESVDLRKQLFDTLAKNDITIFELKKVENTLEDAFLTLVSDNTKNEEESSNQKAKSNKKDSKKNKKGGNE